MKTITAPISSEIGNAVAVFAEPDGTWTVYESIDEIPADRLPVVEDANG